MAADTTEARSGPGCVVDYSPRRRALLLTCADALFLAITGAAGAVVMAATHRLRIAFVASVVLGMVLAMLVQSVLALAMAPILGSIESMVPSMMAGMAGSMAICPLHLLGIRSGLPLSAAVGAAVGLAVSVHLAAYGRRCRLWAAGFSREGER